MFCHAGPYTMKTLLAPREGGPQFLEYRGGRPFDLTPAVASLNPHRPARRNYTRSNSYAPRNLYAARPVYYLLVKQKFEIKPCMGLPVAHVLIYWIPLSVLLWGLILAPLFYFFY